MAFVIERRVPVATNVACGRLGRLQWPAGFRRVAGWKFGVVCTGASGRPWLECRVVCVPAWGRGAEASLAAFEQASGADAVKSMRLSLVHSRRAAQQHRLGATSLTSYTSDHGI